MNVRNPGIANFGITIIQSRHSVRKFKEEDIPSEFVRKALECASKAPTGKNKQPWLFVIIKNKGTLSEIAKLAPNGRFIEGAAVGILVFGEIDWRFTVEDCSAASENLLLALHAYGYGGCWIAGNQMPYADAVRKLTNIPETHKLVSIIAAGIPDIGGINLTEKIPLDKLVFFEKYQ
ncbi:MAG: nitroreductase family protein [Methanocalculaceae archaeon]|jgi:nitroreductase|nr:nitroreductase family protein [Methanocalculaceae archaeon]